MSFPVLVEPRNGEFLAQLLGAPQVSASAQTRDAALEALQQQIQKRVASGELLTIEAAHVALSDLAGTFADDPSILEIGREAYRLRDLDKPE